MKKIFTLIAALFAVAAVNAQTEVTINFDNDYKTLFPTITGESSGTGASAVHDGDFTTTTTSTPVDGVTVTVSAKQSLRRHLVITKIVFGHHHLVFVCTLVQLLSRQQLTSRSW